jgi:hypothetical protein
VNLDITTLITLVSHVTNDLDPDQSFEDPVLQYQAEEERKEKVLPVVLRFMEGKEIIVTNSAWKKVSRGLTPLPSPSPFSLRSLLPPTHPLSLPPIPGLKHQIEGIVSIVGGVKERERAEELKQKITFVDDHPSEYSKQLPTGSRIKQQHIDIFGSGV